MPVTRHTFWQDWDGDNAFVRYARAALEPLGVPPADRDFLAEVGLPAWAAPHMHFAAPVGGLLPPPEDPHGGPYPVPVAGFGMFGSAGGWPLAFDRSRPGTVVWLHPSEAPAGAVVNASAARLAACLLAYNEMVREVLAQGEQRGDPDAWRRGRYPRAVDERLAATIRALDQVAGEADAFWARHFRTHRMDSVPERQDNHQPGR